MSAPVKGGRFPVGRGLVDVCLTPTATKLCLEAEFGTCRSRTSFLAKSSPAQFVMGDECATTNYARGNPAISRPSLR